MNNATDSKDWCPRHQDPTKSVIDVPDPNFPFCRHNFYAQIDDEGKYWVTPHGTVYFDNGTGMFPRKLPTYIDSDGDTVVELFYLKPRKWKVKDLIAMTYNQEDLEYLWKQYSACS